MRVSVIVRMVMSIIIILSVFGCKEAAKIEKLDDLNDKTFGVITGTTMDEAAAEKFAHAKFKYFDNTEDAISAMRAKKIDAVLEDEPFLRILSALNKDLKLLDGVLSEDNYAFAVAYGDEKLLEQVNTVFTDLKNSGTFYQIIERWFPEYGKERKLPSFELSDKNGTLIFGTSSITEPFTYRDEKGDLVGIDIELAYRVAEALEMDLTIIDMQFGALIPSLMSHRVELIGACITITPERAERIKFTQPIYKGGIGVITLK